MPVAPSAQAQPEMSPDIVICPLGGKTRTMVLEFAKMLHEWEDNACLSLAANQLELMCVLVHLLKDLDAKTLTVGAKKQAFLVWACLITFGSVFTHPSMPCLS